MFRYKNEAAFSKAVVSTLRKDGWFVQRVESGETGKGIPDIYAINPQGQSIWIELKREHASIGAMPLPVYVHWRPGQQAWLMQVTRLRQRAITLACFDDVILQIDHTKFWDGNKVLPAYCEWYTSIGQIVRN